MNQLCPTLPETKHAYNVKKAALTIGTARGSDDARARFLGKKRERERGHRTLPRDEEFDGLRDGESEQGGDEGVVVEDGEVGESRGRRRRGGVVGSTTVTHGPESLAPWMDGPGPALPCLILPAPLPAARALPDTSARPPLYMHPAYPPALRAR